MIMTFHLQDINRAPSLPVLHAVDVNEGSCAVNLDYLNAWYAMTATTEQTLPSFYQELA